MLLFSATIPEWVQETADKYMSRDRVIVDLVGKNAVRTAINVEVHVYIYNTHVHVHIIIIVKVLLLKCIDYVHVQIPFHKFYK